MIICFRGASRPPRMFRVPSVAAGLRLTPARPAGLALLRHDGPVITVGRQHKLEPARALRPVPGRQPSSSKPRTATRTGGAVETRKSRPRPGNLCRNLTTARHSLPRSIVRTLSDANESPGSQSGSQRRQIPSHTRPQRATISAGKWHIRPHLAPSGDRSIVPSKQRVAGSNPARRT